MTVAGIIKWKAVLSASQVILPAQNVPWVRTKRYWTVYHEPENKVFPGYQEAVRAT